VFLATGSQRKVLVLFWDCYSTSSEDIFSDEGDTIVSSTTEKWFMDVIVRQRVQGFCVSRVSVYDV